MTRTAYPKTWILTADGRHARVWEWRHPGEPLELVSDFVASSGSRFSRDLKSDKPGRSFASVDARRSAIEPRHDPHEFEKENFAASVSKSIDDAMENARFHRLIVIAPPHMLGNLRHCLSDRSKKLIVGEVDKDLMKADIAAIHYHIAPFVGVA